MSDPEIRMDNVQGPPGRNDGRPADTSRDNPPVRQRLARAVIDKIGDIWGKPFPLFRRDD